MDSESRIPYSTTTDNQIWLEALRGADQDNALADLRDLLKRGLHYALGSRLGGDAQFMVEDFVQEGLIRIMKNIDSFRGESRFTTWAHKVAVHAALTELRRRHWKDFSLQDMLTDYDEEERPSPLLIDKKSTPEQIATQHDALDLVSDLIQNELTQRQREVLTAVLINQVPIEEVAQRMGTSRNALYKMIHDARLRLKQRISNYTGLSHQDVFDIFDESSMLLVPALRGASGFSPSV